MNVLTPPKAVMLARTGTGCDGSRDHASANAAETELLQQLVSEGRARIVECPCHPGTRIYEMTGQGRDALALWRRLKDALLGREA